jgi:3-mercaptopyruvate sulfurtransferase SseA
MQIALGQAGHVKIKLLDGGLDKWDEYSCHDKFSNKDGMRFWHSQ